jgi:hypothetical protein
MQAPCSSLSRQAETVEEWTQEHNEGLSCAGMVLLGAEAQPNLCFLNQRMTVYSWCIVRNKPYTLQKCAFLSEVYPSELFDLI